MTNAGCWVLTSTLDVPTPAAPPLTVVTRVQRESGQDREGEVHLLATSALGPSGVTSILKVSRRPDN
jgi:hypothetical protein